MNTVAAMHPVFSMPVHPAAEIFPMLPEEELLELATNIKSNGLRDSIVIAAEDGIEMLIDGRNRREACKLSGVEPTTRKLPDGTDIKAYVVSANVARRHLTKGQIAMALALIYPEPTNRGGAKNRGSIASNLGLSGELVRQARFVIKHKPDSVDGVMIGELGLAAAYAEAKLGCAARRHLKQAYDRQRQTKASATKAGAAGRSTILTRLPKRSGH